MLTRRKFGTYLAAALTIPGQTWAQTADLYQLQRALINGTPSEFSAALKAIELRGNQDMVAGLIAGMRFTNGPTAEITKVLAHLTGEGNATTWLDWMLWQERNPNVIPSPSFIDFKRDIFLALDPNFQVFLNKEHLQPAAMNIRLEEITWGGVRKDGIPSLDNPMMIPAGDADYMRGDDLVFGVSINGDARAYPLRIMGWHEMFNDVIGGVPVALAYCTLCGSGILFETDHPSLAKPLIFGSSGFLYRSNKLMFDRTTHSLWNQFTGQPVSGILAGREIELQQRPVVIETWDNWRTQNPDTKILSLKTGYRRDYGSGVVYNDYFSSNDLMFPVQVDQGALFQKDYVFGIREFGGAKAWPLKTFAAMPIINDEIQGRPIVLIGDPTTRSVRAYNRGQHRFTDDVDGIKSDGVIWQVTEDALIHPNGETLPRIAGHIAYWFAWNSYLAADSELYDP